MNSGALARLVNIRPSKAWLWIGLAIIFILAIGYFITPPVRGLFYQNQAGKLLSEANLAAGITSTQTIPCSIDPPTSMNARRSADIAATYLLKAIQAYPRDSQNFLLLGRVYCLSGQTAEAVAAYQEYISRRPDNLLGHLELGFAYQLNSNPDLARKEWRVGGADGSTFLQAGKIMLEGSNYLQARAWFARAELLKEPAAQFYKFYTNGLIFESKQEWVDGIYAYQQATGEAQGQISSAYYRIGLIQQEKLSAPSEALQSYRQAVDSDKFITDADKADAHYRTGVILKYYEILDTQARKEFQLAVEYNPYHYGALMELGASTWSQDKDLAGAEKLLQRAISANPSAKYAYISLGGVYEAAGFFDKALLMYNKALSADPTDTTISQHIQEIKTKTNGP